MTKIKSPIQITPLKKIENKKGYVLHAIKSSETTFTKFGEAYFTEVNKGETKGWKKHSLMDMNLIVPVGEVVFHIWDQDGQKGTKVTVGRKKYQRLTIPSKYWVSFTGIKEMNLILNIASIEHDPSESIDAPLDRFPTFGNNYTNLK